MPNSKKTKAPILKQKGEALSYFGADAADMVGACTAPALLSPGPPTLKDMSAQIKNTLRDRPPAYTCKQVLWLSFFFDGTRNNLDADIGTQEHSNVARLFRAHSQDVKSETSSGFIIL